ncbi:M56 family metallopeptidase [Rufibacter glacialis]|uniref:M56 family metallopeptidase n=1 Tax=Rufibacter glacialis TaxID=1259555 RepID=A0A5M8QK48_9BACT|nr:M56 family metallopeptidase [Rufibacter glacialis]KAA6435628.1 M56 family metallopeptidase [Rufibacter glacialis]GGK65120.1 hypothetical protein GCM10011405_11410 [Rufibacter glacialis]
MPALLLYLLQVNVGLTLFYATYQLVLRQTTFYRLNRLFLVSGLLLSGLLPLVDLASLLEEKQQLYQTVQNFAPYWQMPLPVAPAEQGFDVWLIPVVLFWLGAGVMVCRFLLQMASLYAIHRKADRASYQGIKYREVQARLAPFSFGKAIYFNPRQHPQKDWLPILQHEHTHVREWHTLDILLIEITTLFNWFNPAVWLLRKSLKQNLEFLTDQRTLEAGIDRKQYQFSLLHTAGVSPLSFTTSFSFPSLKHRIKMMNKAPSAQAQKVRFLAVLPLLFSGLIACHGIAGTSSELGGILPQENSLQTVPTQDHYEAFLKRNPAVKRITWSGQAIQVYLKSGETEQYASTPEGIAQAEKKYGALPGPPPPPPVPAAAPLAPEAAMAPPPPPPPFRKDWPKEFLERNPSVKGFTGSEDTFYVLLKNGEIETFDQSPAGVAALEKKYGPLPAPPPPVRAKVGVSTSQEEKLFPPVVKKKFSPPVIKRQEAKNLPPDYQDFLKRNPTVNHIYWTENSFHVVLKSGTNEVFPKSEAGYKAAEKKYGKLPASPPPPPIHDLPLPQPAPKPKN